MAINSSVQTRIDIDRKIQFVLSTYLNAQVDAVNASLPSGYQIAYPQTIMVGIDAISLNNNSNILNMLPAVAVVDTSSTVTKIDFAEAQTERIVYTVSALVGSGQADYSLSARQARYLALAAAQALEAYLCTPTGYDDESVIYRCDLESSSLSISTPMKKGLIYLVGSSVQIVVYARSRYNVSASVMPDVDVAPGFQQNYLPEDLSGVVEYPSDPDTAFNPKVFKAISVGLSPLQKAAATSVVITVPVALAVYHVVNQTTETQIPVTASAGPSPTITIDPSDVGGLDVWTLAWVHPTYGVLSTYTINW